MTATENVAVISELIPATGFSLLLLAQAWVLA